MVFSAGVHTGVHHDCFHSFQLQYYRRDRIRVHFLCRAEHHRRALSEAALVNGPVYSAVSDSLRRNVTGRLSDPFALKGFCHGFAVRYALMDPHRLTEKTRATTRANTSVLSRVHLCELAAEEQDLGRVVDPGKKDRKRTRRAICGFEAAAAHVQADSDLA